MASLSSHCTPLHVTERPNNHRSKLKPGHRFASSKIVYNIFVSPVHTYLSANEMMRSGLRQSCASQSVRVRSVVLLMLLCVHGCS